MASKTMLSTIPNELLYAIAKMLDENGINSLARSNRFFFSILNPVLYLRNMLHSDGWALIWAILNHQVQTMIYALETGVTVLGEALALAAEDGQEQVMQLLLAVKSADFSAKYRTHDQYTQAKWTSAKRIASKSRLASSRRLASLKARLGWKEDQTLDQWDQWSPLSRACIGSHLETVKILVNSGQVNLEHDEYEGRTALSHAAEHCDSSVVKALLGSGKVNADSKDYEGRTPLSYAVEHSDLLSLDRWVGPHWDEISVTRDPKARKPLPDTSTLKYLIDSGKAHPDCKNRHGRTPLSYAAQHSDVAAVKLLLETSAVNIDLEDEDGCSPFYFAVSAGNASAAELLLKSNRINTNPRDLRGIGPVSNFFHGWLLVDITYDNVLYEWEIQEALDTNYRYLLKLLVECKGIDLDCRDFDGRTPLSYAAEKLDIDVVQALLNSGRVEVDSRDNEGRTPLSYAIEGQDLDCIRLLMESGKVDLDSRDIHGRTPLEYPSHCKNEIQTLVNALKSRDLA